MSIEAAKAYLESKTGSTYIAPEQGRLNPSAMMRMIEALCVFLYYPVNSSGFRPEEFDTKLVAAHVKPTTYIPFPDLGFTEEELLALLVAYEKVRDGGTRREVVQEDM